MLIREYRPEDFDALWRLDQECFRPGIAYSRFELMHYIRRKGAFTLVAEHERGAAAQGFLVAECCQNIRASVHSKERRSVGHIITIDVSGKAQRSGVGTRLMDAAEERIVAAGGDAVYLETAVDNTGAITFYKRRGYSVLSTIPRYYDGQLDALVMGKRLRPPHPGANGERP